jgi:hypothetical protein
MRRDCGCNLSEFGHGDQMLWSLPIRLGGPNTCFLIFGRLLSAENGACLHQFLTDPRRAGLILFCTLLALIPNGAKCSTQALFSLSIRYSAPVDQIKCQRL